MRGMARTATAALMAVGITVLAGVAVAAEGTALKSHDWPFEGVFGRFDQAALQRGYQVYRDVCSACHSVRFLTFRNLEGIGFGADRVKALAATFEVEDGPNDEGDMFSRPGRPSDPLPKPFPNPQAARAANGGALPPDLSLIAVAREGGPNYIFSILTGYQDAPADFELTDGKNYNPYFPGHQIGMPEPLFDEAVDYADGTKATVDQMAGDVAQFLAWASEPTMVERKRIGIKVVLFLLVLTGLLYASKRKVWSKIKSH